MARDSVLTSLFGYNDVDMMNVLLPCHVQAGRIASDAGRVDHDGNLTLIGAWWRRRRSTDGRDAHGTERVLAYLIVDKTAARVGAGE